MRQNNEALWEMVGPVVAGLGYELVEIEYLSQDGMNILRIYIDQESGITADDCAKVSLQLSALFDVEEPMSARYNLEVSSPGLDRPLRKVSDFERFAGNKVKIKMTMPVGMENRRNFTGVLVGVVADQARIEVDGEAYELPIAAIEKARIIPKY
ncbi:MAG: ribosome maturation factor RimP [Gammaproteobacteria bacterium]|nr:ribosome maturation factor RimP [Gammaproteobacteria bacterium]